MVTILVNASYADDIKTLSKYLDSLKSVTIDFTQFDARNGKSEGKLVIIKPYNFRCNYYKPYPLLIVGNKHELAIYDFDLENATKIDRKENLFNFILTSDKDWEKDFELIDISKTEASKIFKLYHADSERIIHIAMNKEPFRIKQIIIDEADANVIEINLSNIKNISPDIKGLFSIPNPEVFGPPKRLSKKDLEKVLSK